MNFQGVGVASENVGESLKDNLIIFQVKFPNGGNESVRTIVEIDAHL